MRKKPAKALGFVVFSSGKEAEQVTVGDGAQFFRAVVEVKQAVLGEDTRFLQAVLSFQTVKRGHGNTEATVSSGAGFQTSKI